MTHLALSKPVGCWRQRDFSPESFGPALQQALLNVGSPIYIVDQQGRLAISQTGTAELGRCGADALGGLPLLAYVPPLHPRALGDPVFKATHGLHYAYVAGEMAHGITSVRMVMEAGKSGLVGFFGAGGLMLREVGEAVDQLQRAGRQAVVDGVEDQQLGCALHMLDQVQALGAAVDELDFFAVLVVEAPALLERFDAAYAEAFVGPEHVADAEYGDGHVACSSAALSLRGS